MMDAAAARISPVLWSKHMHPERKVPAHVRYLSNVLRSEIVRGMQTGIGAIVIVSMPPGHIKSDTCSVHLPEWFLEGWPDRNVALASYGHRKTAEWGRRIRNDIRDRPDLFSIRLSEDSKATDQFHTQHGGSILCTGVGGPLTGFRAHLLVVDDPVKDEEEALSEVMREKTFEWFRTVAFTRCWPEAVKLVVMTRWHEDDLVGRIHELFRSKGEHSQYPIVDVRFPAEAEDDDPLGREPGDPLWPEGGYGREWIEATKHLVGSRHWATMYQQRPAPAAGSMFRREHLRYFAHNDSFFDLGDGRRFTHHECARFQIVDTAQKTKTINDYTVSGIFAVTPHRDLLVLDVARARLEVPDQLPFIRQHAKRWLPRWIGVEDKGSGTGIIQESRRHGVPFRAIAARVDKVERASPAAVMVEAGKVFLRDRSAWLDDLERELLVFPNGTHDDQVDVLAHAVNEMGGGPSRPKSGRRREAGSITGLAEGAFKW